VYGGVSLQFTSKSSGKARPMIVLPATACVIGALVLRQIPSHSEMIGIGSVIVGVALRRSES
jgi:threonine/homoserine efflux transporter RhtA